MATVGLIGTLDTKSVEYHFVKERIEEAGTQVLIVDVGGFSDPDGLATITAGEVAAAAGADLQTLRGRGDRGETMAAMARGAAVIAVRLWEEGRIDGLFAIGGSSGSSVAAHAMQALPVGVPKLLVSTMASGDVSPYVGESDVTLMYSVVDVAGINAISSQVLGNAAVAAAAMAERYAAARVSGPDDDSVHRPTIGITMFGVTTPAADEARAELTALGYDTLVFHATGSGGRSMEKLVSSGLIAGVLDLTTTELADDLVGGVLSAGPDRLEAAGRAGVPQVVSVGALDMVNFGPRETVPERFADRLLLVHNPTITLMRTTPAEMGELGRRIARKLRDAAGPTALVLPLRGVSAIDVAGGPFVDEAADEALFSALRDGLDGSSVDVVERDLAINDEGFGREAARALHALIEARGAAPAHPLAASAS